MSLSNRRYLRFHALAIALIAIVLFNFHQPANAADKIDEKKQSLSTVKEKLKSLKKALGGNEEAHKDAADALKASELAISKTNKKLYNINQQQIKNKSRLKKLNAEIAQTNKVLSNQQKQLSKQLYHQYTHGQQDYLQLILQEKHPNETQRDIAYYRYIANARAEIIREMQGNLKRLNDLNKKTELALAEVQTLKQKQVAERSLLETQKAEKSEVVQKLLNKIAQQRVEIKKLARDEKNLSTLVKRLAKIAKKKKAAALKAKKAKQAKAGKKTIAKNNRLPNKQLSGLEFSKLKGKLRLPVKGNIKNRFGKKRKGSDLTWKGIFIQTNEGTHVKTIADGSVIFADWMRGFGNLIIIDHGNGYMSLYGNNQAMLKATGDTVKAGDVVATVGNTGGNTNNGLYYELRKNSKPFDPLSWSKLH